MYRKDRYYMNVEYIDGPPTIFLMLLRLLNELYNRSILFRSSHSLIR
jgi:hypothetical protein